MLSKIYADLKASKGLEVVFVSADQDDDAFKEYFGSMPWLALPFEQRDKAKALNKKFKVQGIPTLVIVDGNGELITTNGRAAVSEDPQGAKFPWKPPTLQSMFAKVSLITNKDEQLPVGHLKGKVVGLYFSAHWYALLVACC